MINSEDNLVVIGTKSVLWDDPEKAWEINSGQLLVPWCGMKSCLIDRYDCRAHLPELQECSAVSPVANEPYLSEEEIAIEKMCEFERYLELQVDVDELATNTEEEKKRVHEDDRQYGAVGFSYEEPEERVSTPITDKQDDANGQDPDDKPYVCPPELQKLGNIPLPSTDKQAQIIERTAVFVARQGNQMEIILKAKQNNNPLFDFLNYDNELNEFYKEMVRLIRQGRYVPKIRPTPQPEQDASANEQNKSINEDNYELKLPKVDISNTAYASLINKFKKVNETLLQVRATAAEPLERKPSVSANDESSEAVVTTDLSSSHLGSAEQCSTGAATANNDHVISDSAAPSTTVTHPPEDVQCSSSQLDSSFSTENYEKYYQEYYTHYYPYYYAQFSEQHTGVTNQGTIPEEQHEAIVREAVKAAAVAASAAVNAMHQAQAKQKQSTTSDTPHMTPGERGIIEKMAEYVARNGIEFEELVSQQKGNDPRFGFLKPTHPLHNYYMSRRKDWDVKAKAEAQADSIESDSRSPAVPQIALDGNTEHQDCASGPDDLNKKAKAPDNLPTDRQSSISFKLARPFSSNKLHASGADSPSMSLPAHVYVHPSTTSTIESAASCPVLVDQYDSPENPSTPANSVTSNAADSSPIVDYKHPDSPVFFHLPGVPSASPSSNSSDSSRESSPEVAAPKQSPPRVRSDIAISQPKQTQKLSPKPSGNHFLYPRTDVPCASNSPKTHFSNRLAIDSPVNFDPLLIEDILDLETDSCSSSHSSLSTAKHGTQASLGAQRSLQERRKRAAQAFAQLKASASTGDACDQVAIPSAGNRVSDTPSLPPPPAPDSVPAAVAHAVVASLKRRHEESLATLEAQTKARRRLRSPPAAYALPKHKSHKSSKHSKRSSRSPSPASYMDFDSYNSRTKKHVKSKKSRRSSS